jgi:hypothetical protein
LPLPLYLLGLDIQERWTFAVDITAARELFMVCNTIHSWLCAAAAAVAAASCQASMQQQQQKTSG